MESETVHDDGGGGVGTADVRHNQSHAPEAKGADRTVTACEPDPEKGSVYEIDVRGHVGEIMRHAFPDLEAGWRGPNTRFRGRLPDQAALYGVLAQLEALGLELLEVRRLPP
jgi:hypothetical protein